MATNEMRSRDRGRVRLGDRFELGVPPLTCEVTGWNVPEDRPGATAQIYLTIVEMPRGD